MLSCRRFVYGYTKRLHLSLNVAQTESPESDLAGLHVTKATTCKIKLVPSVPAMYIQTAVGLLLFATAIQLVPAHAEHDRDNTHTWARLPDIKAFDNFQPWPCGVPAGSEQGFAALNFWGM